MEQKKCDYRDRGLLQFPDRDNFIVDLEQYYNKKDEKHVYVCAVKERKESSPRTPAVHLNLQSPSLDILKGDEKVAYHVSLTRERKYMFDCYVGIDISKDFFDVSVEVQGKEKHNQFSQTEKGFQALLRWLEKVKVTNATYCMEATKAYWYDLADFLSLAGESVSVVNPTFRGQNRHRLLLQIYHSRNPEL